MSGKWLLGITVCVCAAAQPRFGTGHSIGTISTEGNLIVMTLNDGALGRANLFDLAGRTVRFTRKGSGYTIENRPLQWDPEFGGELSGPQVTLHRFAFPFSGKEWDSFSAGVTGSIAFGAALAGGRGGRGGVSVDRFAQLQQAGRTLIGTVPAICVFFKPRMSGQRYFKELEDRAVLTWSLTEPAGGIQDFTWTPTVNRFQAVLHKDGSIEMSYQEMAAKDGIVGVYPLIAEGKEKEIAAIDSAGDPSAPAHLDVRKVRIAAVDGLLLKVTLETRGPLLAEGDPALAGVTYRVSLGSAVWTVAGGGRGGRGRYVAFGPGVLPGVQIEGNRLTIQGTLPPGVREGERLAISAAGARPREVMLAGIRSPEVDLSAARPQDGAFPIAYEAFHYLALPDPRDLSCTVIQALGDRFDMLAYYSDFRVDNQEAGTPSNGPLGGGPAGGAVTGIGATQRGLESYCSQGRFQWEFIQPVYVGSNQMQERPPEGLTDTNTHNIATYAREIGERAPDGRILPYDYAMSQIGHEMGHRWSAFVSAKVNGETIPLGPTHWARGLQAPAAFPYQRPVEASAMGGGVWQDNYDGTFTQLDDDYYVPATGYSYLDLYLMGLIGPAEVPDFFILRNLQPAGRDRNGHPMFRADRTKVTIEDVIAAEGPRLPDVAHAQKKFNTGIVVVVEHGAKPSRELIERANGIRERWMDYWETVTGHRASMTASPR
ncbi:MAG TPA: hypothetical protein VKX45_09940 [Bryobacteraceae bacterium]|jgi:hypothetical protein|nr:hypothetical protein [Bryobacteraceae bacterium]